MSYKFDKNEMESLAEERLKEMLIPDGEHTMRICTAEQRKSKSGNEMFVLELVLEGTEKKVMSYLVLTPDWHEKFKMSCIAFGIGDKYDAGEVDSKDYVNKKGLVKISQYEDAEYGWKNVVEKFIESEDCGEELVDDDIPF
jgi:hypothetical protein